MTDDPKPLVRRPVPPQSTSHPLVTPIYPAVAYVSADADDLDDQYEGRAYGYTYAREGHPNARILAGKIDGLEGAAGGILTGSGMAAIGAVYLGLLSAGDHVVAGDQLYGRNLRMLNEDLPRQGVAVDLVNASDTAAVRAKMRDTTKLVVVETLSNPTLRVADVAALAKIAHEFGALLFVDNTFTTPAMIRPFEHDADIVMHSVTKLLAGHSDVTLGYVVARDKAVNDAIELAAVTWGMTASPFDCWLAERGIQSFDLRFERAQENARQLADVIAACPGVTSVLYPTRSDHPDFERAQASYGANGGNMLSFTLDGERDVVNAFLRAAKDIPFAPTLGDIGTSISHPASSSHRGLTAEKRIEMGIPEAFFRISVGVDNIDHLSREFTQAIGAAMS